MMFVIYGIGMAAEASNLSGGLPIVISNAFCVAIAVVTLVIKFKNMSRAKKEHLTEFQYWEKHYKKNEEIK
jgi:uncharacterized protein with PQ loop repeat